MLIEHRFDVTEALRPGQTNRIAVRLGSAVNHARRLRYDASTMSWEHREEGLFIRKAPHMWGWDIMPRAVSAGIWQHPSIRRWKGARRSFQLSMPVAPSRMPRVIAWGRD